MLHLCCVESLITIQLSSAGHHQKSVPLNKRLAD